LNASRNRHDDEIGRLLLFRDTESVLDCGSRIRIGDPLLALVVPVPGLAVLHDSIQQDYASEAYHFRFAAVVQRLPVRGHRSAILHLDLIRLHESAEFLRRRCVDALHELGDPLHALLALLLEERHVVLNERHEFVVHALQHRLDVDRRGVEALDLLLERGDLLLLRA
jgi:hypothetical protein